MKKNIWKLAGIIALVAVTGLGLAGCNNGSTPGGGGNITTIIIKNRSGTSITVELEDNGASGYEILSGLGTKTIDNNAEGTWSLECSAKRGGYVGIIINDRSEWNAYEGIVGRTHELTWDGLDLTQPPQ
jgi:hypothetical protein